MSEDSANPTDYFCQHHIVERTNSGLNVVRYPALWTVLYEAGVFDHDHEKALRVFEKMRHYTKGGSGGSMPEDYPTLKDGYNFITRCFKRSPDDFDIVKELTDNVYINDLGVEEIRANLPKVHARIVGAVDRLHSAVRDFERKREVLLERMV